MKRQGSNCSECPLAACAYVPSFIPDDPRFIVVGEAPGAQEVRAKKPFVGPSGVLLGKALERLGFNLDRDFVQLNAVGCKAPDNDVPFEAVKACAGGLRTDLERFQTQDILALGGTALQALDILTPYVYRDGITKRHGIWHQLGKRRYLGTFHPAFVLRSPNYISQLYADFRKFTKLVKPVDVMAASYVVITDTNWAMFATQLERLENNTPVAFDIETDNLNLWGNRSEDPAPLLCIVLTWKLEFSAIIPAEVLNQERIKFLNTFLDRMITIAHNGKFDQNGLQREGFHIRLDHDTMLMSYMLNEQTRGAHGLKLLASQLLDTPDYEGDLIDKWFQERRITSVQREYSLLPKNILYRYAGIDGVATLALFHTLKPELEKDGVLEAYQMIMKHSAVTQAAEYCGILIDRSYLQKAEIRFIAELEYLAQKMWEYLRDHYAGIYKLQSPYYKNKIELLPPETYDQLVEEGEEIRDTALEVRRGRSKYFNPKSHRQMQWALYELLKLQHVKPLSYKTKSTSTNVEALEALPQHPFVQMLLQHRRASKILDTYVKNLLAMADRGDRIHVSFNLHGTETGRLSADKGLHGLPRPEDEYGKIIQGAFIAPPGKKLIKADFSQAELRAFAAESQEDFLLERYRQGEDIHLATAKLVFADEFVKNPTPERVKYLRQIAKQVNFGGLVYLGGPSGIAAMLHGYGVEITATQLGPILNAYKRKMPKAIAWQIEQFRKAKRDGFVQSRLGRKRRFLLITDDTIEEIRKASVNAPIQSVASDLNLIAAHRLQFEFGLQVLHLVHDSIILEVPEETASDAAVTVKRVMEETAEGIYPELPWVADVSVATRLYEDRPKL